MGIVDLEPRKLSEPSRPLTRTLGYTFRGHKGAILSLATADTGQFFITGGADATICCWDLPSFNIPVYDHYGEHLRSSFDNQSHFYR